jgi:methionine-rich copper-binding protein CopC
VLVLLCVTACAPSLAAPPRLVASWPTDGARLPLAARTVELTFNRSLSAEDTWAAVSLDGAAGNPIAARSAVDPSDARRLTVELLTPTEGAYRLHWHAVSARTDVSNDGEIAFTLEAKAASAPELVVSSASVENGERIWVTGHNFEPRSAVRLTMGDDEQSLMNVQSDAQGGFDDEVHVPAGVAFGEQRITGVDASGGTAAAAVLVRWGGWPPLVAFTVGDSGPQRGEVSFSISLRNRSDYVLERVRVVLDDPDGATFVRAEPSTVHQAGELAWDIPMLDRGPAGPLVAIYRVTGPTASHATIEFRHRRPRGCTADECLSAFVSETTSDSALVTP